MAKKKLTAEEAIRAGIEDSIARYDWTDHFDEFLYDVLVDVDVSSQLKDRVKAATEAAIAELDDAELLEMARKKVRAALTPR